MGSHAGILLPSPCELDQGEAGRWVALARRPGLHPAALAQDGLGVSGAWRWPLPARFQPAVP